MKEKNQSRRLRITIKPFAKVIQEAMKVCKRAEKGLIAEEATEELNFTNAATMLSTISKKRMELMMFLHQNGPSNIKQLSKKLGRDYSSVHGDVQLLIKIGLLTKNKMQEVFVPWDELMIELPVKQWSTTRSKTA